MNFVDIAILVCCVPALIHGISKGFIKQATALLSPVLGAWLAFKFSEPVGDLLQNYIEIPGTVIHIIAFALIMVLVTVVLKLLGNILEKTVKFVMPPIAETNRADAFRYAAASISAYAQSMASNSPIGSFGSAESRFCIISDTFVTAPPVQRFVTHS